MDNPYPRGPPHHQPPPYGGGYMESQHTGRPTSGHPTHDSAYTEQSAWTSSHGYHSFTFPPPPSGAGGYGGPAHMAPPYAFDPSVPPPPLGCPPPGHFPVNAYGGPGAPNLPALNPYYAPGPQSSQHDFQPPAEPSRKHQEYAGSAFPRSVGAANPPLPPPPLVVDETALQRKQDEQWLKGFLLNRAGPSKDAEPKRKPSVSVGHFKDRLLSATRLLSELTGTLRTLELRLEDEGAWSDSYQQALDAKAQLQEKLSLLTDAASVSELKAKLGVIAKRKARRRRSRQQMELEERQREESIALRDAAIDEWRMKQIRKVEEKKKEQELKQAADSVLCEVRKKQADMKRMQDILRSLEKLRKLRKEAASRKGIVTDQESDEAFSGQLEKLRSVIRTRTVIYSAEEKALMVMLEGEQEEERRRDLERQLKKERERQLQRKRKVDAMLFGDDLPDDPMMQPFRDFYTQAERSLHAVVQIRRAWDVFLVPVDHPDGTRVPQNWVLPDAPSDPAWASALQNTESECDGL